MSIEEKREAIRALAMHAALNQSAIRAASGGDIPSGDEYQAWLRRMADTNFTLLWDYATQPNKPVDPFS